MHIPLCLPNKLSSFKLKLRAGFFYQAASSRSEDESGGAMPGAMQAEEDEEGRRPECSKPRLATG
jgi:hypothetical protein